MGVALSVLMDKLSRAVGDYLQVTVTTALATNHNVISTELPNYLGNDQQIVRNWVYVKDYANAGAVRKISGYTNSTGAVVCSGQVFSSDSSDLATVQIHKIDPRIMVDAINRAARETKEYLFRYVTDTSLAGDGVSYEFVLPSPFDDPNSAVNKVSIVGDDVINDIFDYRVQFNVSGERVIYINHMIDSGDDILIEGTCPLEDDLEQPDDEMTLSEFNADLLVEYAAYLVMSALVGMPAMLDRTYYQKESQRRLINYRTLALQGLRMTRPQVSTQFKMF